MAPIVGQLIFAEDREGFAALDFVPTMTLQPHGPPLGGVPVTLLARLPADPRWRELITGCLDRWAREARELELELEDGHGSVVLRSATSMVRLEAVPV